MKGYTQNLVFDRAHGRGKPASYDELPIDGIVELWFSDRESLDAGYELTLPARRSDRAEEFIAEISTFLVETHEVV